jgi:hypothetical protein
MSGEKQKKRQDNYVALPHPQNEPAPTQSSKLLTNQKTKALGLNGVHRFASPPVQKGLAANPTVSGWGGAIIARHGIGLSTSDSLDTGDHWD